MSWKYDSSKNIPVTILNIILTDTDLGTKEEKTSEF